VNAGDAVAIGLAQNYVPAARMGAFVEAVIASGDVEGALAEYSAPAPDSKLLAQRATIDACFGKSDVAGILAALAADGSEFAEKTRTDMLTKSPTSMAVARAQMNMGGALDIEGAMRAEYRVVSRICLGKDFYEGVRATIIDKDKNPKWSPADIADVRQQDIDAMFAPLADDIFV
jgi:enoyl-CoA hydratase